MARALHKKGPAIGTTIAFAALVVSLLPSAAAAAEGYYRYPTLRGDTLVFAAEGDLWRVPLAGGQATRLTSHPGEESHAALSPDGTRVAFSARYEGAAEVYVMPLAGGRPERLTWEGRWARVVGWTDDGRVLYRTRAFSTLPQWQLATVDPETGETEPLPLSQAYDGSRAADGTLFFTRFPLQSAASKRYRGGMAQSLWKFAPGADEAEHVTTGWDGTSTAPMCGNGRVAFLSDRDGVLNIWSMDESGGDLRQHTRHDEWDARSPQRDGDTVVFQRGADLWRVDLTADREQRIPITLPSDLDQTRARWIEDPFDYLSSVAVAPDGESITFTVRGVVFTAPVKQGRLARVTREDDVRYLGASFLGGTSELLAFSDASDELDLWKLPANGVGAPERLTELPGNVHRFDPTISADGRWIAWTDKDLKLWVFDAERKRTIEVDESPTGWFFDLAWSPDDRWLAYVKSTAGDFYHIRLYDTESGDRIDATTPRTLSYAPAWSPDGKWLWFLSDRNLRTLVGSPWGPYQPEPFLDRTTELFALDLPGGQRSPFRPDDEVFRAEQAAAAEEESGDDDGDGGDGEDDGVKVVIERDGLTARLIQAPAGSGNFGALAATATHLLWTDVETTFDRDRSLKILEITNDDPKVKTVASGIAGYEMSGDRESLLIRKSRSLHVVGVGADADLDGGRVDLSGFTLNLDPRAEWRQMFRDAWRLERDWFYDPGMHGLDWDAVYDRYAPLVERVTTRQELRDLLFEMVGELSASHTYVYGGDDRAIPDDVAVGSLGARYSRAGDGWRIDRIYESDPEFPDQLAPLAQHGLGVEEGDVIVAVNGERGVFPPRALRRQAGRQVLLTLRPGGKGDERDVIVVPISAWAERNLRYRDWELDRRQRVDEASDGRLGYLHIRGMGASDFARFARDFYPAHGREGIILDARRNTGGNIESWILSRLMREDWMHWQGRAGQSSPNMQWAYRGKLVVLCNEATISDGEVFVEGFRELGLGKVIGTRTLGGEIWLTSSNNLRDQGIATAAEFGVFTEDDGWIIEGHGVEPDLVVDNLPHATFEGGDAQLDAAIRHLLDELERDPVEPVEAPPYPVKRR